MLGWEFFVSRQGHDEHDVEAPTLASWQASLGGTKWLDDLVTQGVATDHGGNGYPNRYDVPAGALVTVLERGLPEHRGPPVLGDDYFLPSGWTGNARIDMARLRAIDPGEILIVEAWDQS